MVRIASALLCCCPFVLGGCGSDQPPEQAAPSTAAGALAVDPPLRVASFDATTFASGLSSSASGAQLLQLAGTPTCGIDVYYLNFWTRGGAGEMTLSSGAMMVPTGASSSCHGRRPIVLYGHGPQTAKAFNIANIADPANVEGLVMAALFAAQGFIVVAPNYAGYDISTLGYHPFLDAAQQSGEMHDILTAARAALPDTLSSATEDGGKLFLTGFSEGGYVAMATQRAMQAAGETVTASVPISGPYALEAFGDAIFFGNVELDSPVIAVFLSTGYQHAYGNLYTSTTDVYSAQYAANIDTLLPSTMSIDTIIGSGLLPATALFDSDTPVVSVPGNPGLSSELTAALAVPGDAGNKDTPLFDLGFGSSYLIINAFRTSYALDAASDPDGAFPTAAAAVPIAASPPDQPLRQAFYKNDLRNPGWTPTVPTLMCGASEDPVVFFQINTITMQTFWQKLPAGVVSVLDVDAAPAGPFAAIQAAFQSGEAQQLAYLQTAAGGGLSAAAAAQSILENYHTSVAPFCAAAARAFFSQF
jgi:hypothetical protein